MNWEGFLILIILLSLSINLTGLIWRKIDVLKLISISVFITFAGYVIVSGFLFWIDEFTIYRSISIESVFLIILNIYFIYKNKTFKFEITYINRDIVLYIIILVGFFISYEKFDYFGMGQDQGVYQVKAIQLMNGYTKNQQDFREYDLLVNEKEKEEYDNFIKRQGGFYKYDNRPTLNEKNKLSPVSGIFHGIPTFPAVLALFGSIFGIENMHMINSIFYLCAMFFILFIIENLKLKRVTSYLIITLVALCPVIQWVNKSTLTENGLYFIMSAFLYGITSESGRKYLGISILSIWVYSFYHVSTFALIPMFVLVFLILYLETNNKDYLYSNVISLIGFYLGFLMMLFVSPKYSFDNINKSIGYPGDINIIPIMSTSVLILLILNVLITKEYLKKIYFFLKKEYIFKILIRSIIVICVLFIIAYTVRVYLGYIPVWVAHIQPYYSSDSIMEIVPHIGLISMFILVGILVLPITIFVLFKNPEKIKKTTNLLIVGIMFIYSVLIFSAFMKKEIYFFYYYARYLAPFIIIALIGAGLILNQIKTKFLVIIIIVSALILMPYDIVLLKEKDDSRLSWYILKDISEKIEPDSAIIFEGGRPEENYQRMIALPIKSMTKSDIYPLTDNIKNQLTLFEGKYKNIYFIMNDSAILDFRDRLTNVYYNSYIMSQDDEKIVNKYLKLPKGFNKKEINVGLYRYISSKLEYNMADKNISRSIRGFDNIENNNFRWIKSNNAEIDVYLNKEAYMMNVIMGPGIPLGSLKRKEFTFDIMINNKLKEKVTLTNENMSKPITLFITKDELLDGKNTIGFKGSTWSPSEYGSGDKRNLMISISNITFKPMLQREYNFNDESLMLKGFDRVEENKFRWVNSDLGELITFLDKKSYNMLIKLGPPIPLDNLGYDSYSFDILINGKNIKTITLNKENIHEPVSLLIKEDELKYGENTISFKGPTWSPSEYGSKDKRKLMISLARVEFKEIEKEEK